MPIMDAQPLILGADQNGAEDVSGDEEEEEAIVHVRVAVGVEDGEEDQPDRARDGEDDAEHAEHLLRARGVAREPARVSQVPLREEGQVEEHRRDDRAGDKERFERKRPHVGDVGYGLRAVHRGGHGYPGVARLSACRGACLLERWVSAWNFLREEREREKGEGEGHLATCMLR